MFTPGGGGYGDPGSNEGSHDNSTVNVGKDGSEELLSGGSLKSYQMLQEQV